MSVLAVDPIEITIHCRASVDRYINAAVEQMIEGALRHRTHGILVTRLGDGHFVIGLSEAVPFGYTEQRDSRAQSS